MKKVIKVIDLLNMIANGEELPRRIEYANIVWQRTENAWKYSYFNEEDCITENIMDYISISNLNYEVEILEDTEEIDIQKINEEDLIIISEIKQRENCLTTNSIINKKIMNTINNLIDEVKQLDNKLKEK